jgi:hypothetical protein
MSVLAGLALMCGAPRADATEPSEGNAAAAESLFQDARKLIEAKRYAEACPKLVASHKLAPAVGTVLNLADCYERAGLNASAWARFHEAIALAQRLGRADREQTARERAERLDPRLIRLLITTHENNLEVTLDGTVLDSAALGSAIPVDPGRHVVEATANGRVPFRAVIEVSDAVHTPRVDVPTLSVMPKPVIATAPPVVPGKDTSSNGNGQRYVSYALLGVGLAGVAVGTVFGLRTASKWNDAKDHCSGTLCDDEGATLTQQAKNNGLVSTIAFVAGGVLLAGGAVLFFTAPSRKPAAKQASFYMGLGAGSAFVGGSF